MQGATEQLQELGLSRNEADLYLVLLEFGPVTAGLISKKAKINRTSTYQILDRLIATGLVSYVSKGKRRIFQAASPQTLLSHQEEKSRVAKKLVPELEKISRHIEEQATIYSGRRGIRVIMNDILEHKEYVSFGSAGQFLDVMGHDFFLFQREKQRRKIKSRVIIGSSSREKPIVTQAHAEFRFVDDAYMTPTTTWVYNDKVAIIIWSGSPIATLINSKEVAQAYGAYFELLWQTAKK